MNQTSATPAQKAITEAYKARRARWEAAAAKVQQDQPPARKDVWTWSPEREAVEQDEHMRDWETWSEGLPRLKRLRLILAARAAELGTSYRKVVTPSRDPALVALRHKLLWELRTHVEPGISWAELARVMRMDHSTVMYAFHKLEAQISGSEEAKAYVRRQRGRMAAWNRQAGVSS